MMNQMFHHFVFFYLFTCNKASLMNYHNEIIDKGRQQYELIKQETRAPKFSSCWTKAIQKLENDCKALTDDRQMDLALAFTNCFLQKSGKEPFSCIDQGTVVKNCLENADVIVFTTYTTFFTHTHSMCYFLQSQVWNEMTDDLIVKLTHSSKNVEHQLKESGELQLQLLSRQEKAILSQEELLKKGHDLGQLLEVSKENFRELKSDTEEQRMLVLEIFDRITNLQSLLVGEFTGFYSVIYYILASCILYLLTSTQKTNGSRLAVFMLLCLNFGIERVIVSWGMESSDTNYFDNSTNELYNKIWLCRKLFALMIVMIIAVGAHRYQDYNQVNNRLLQEIQQDIMLLHKELGRTPIKEHSSQELNGETYMMTKIEQVQNDVSGSFSEIIENFMQSPVKPSTKKNGKALRSTVLKSVNSRRKKKVSDSLKNEYSSGYDSASEVSSNGENPRYNLRQRRSTTPQCLETTPVSSPQCSNKSLN